MEEKNQQPDSSPQEAELRKKRSEAASASAGTSSEAIYHAMMRALKEHQGAGDVLDFGAGTGDLSRRLCEQAEFTTVMAADIVGFEGRYEHPKLRWMLADLNQAFPCGTASFDVVVAAEVIEHLENPRFVLREFYRLLRPGGFCLVSTPNNEAWRSIVALVGKGHFASFADESYPAHITALLRKDLERSCNEAGFKNVKFLYTDYGVLPKLTRIRWQRVSFGLLRGLRFSDNLLCLARKPSGEPE